MIFHDLLLITVFKNQAEFVTQNAKNFLSKPVEYSENEEHFKLSQLMTTVYCSLM